MPLAKINDIQMYYEIHGEGEPLVLINGLANDITDNERVIRALSQHYKVLAFDNRGAGRSDKPDSPYSIEMMATDTVGLMQAVGIQQAHIMGISMGGSIALALTLRHPTIVKKLVLVSTAARVIRTWQRRLLIDALSKISTSVLKGRYPQPYYAFVRQREASSRYDCTDQLPELQVPTLIMHGRNDRITPYTLAEEMHARIPGSQMLTFHGGHLVLFFRQKECIDAIVDFLTKSDHM